MQNMLEEHKEKGKSKTLLLLKVGLNFGSGGGSERGPFKANTVNIMYIKGLPRTKWRLFSNPFEIRRWFRMLSCVLERNGQQRKWSLQLELLQNPTTRPLGVPYPSAAATAWY